ncbi:putative Glycosaminoglycan polysaccharide lyase [Giardia muris]|uniref:Putative Glycosaminoglycan polysaccharide lyase n=1 Tax=Giardia muris TaxID=5742 RepID=A0A4Z1SMP4_GIAMU|nr:putative Glycosaminoglycan polysaccharide lyase [Giardia muris]|eukprot:TNJ26972.1 putative Glycosaminoglycan polysaccharide lyase [Giardia muris]
MTLIFILLPLLQGRFPYPVLDLDQLTFQPNVDMLKAGLVSRRYPSGLDPTLPMMRTYTSWLNSEATKYVSSYKSWGKDVANSDEMNHLLYRTFVIGLASQGTSNSVASWRDVFTKAYGVAARQFPNALNLTTTSDGSTLLFSLPSSMLLSISTSAYLYDALTPDVFAKSSITAISAMIRNVQNSEYVQKCMEAAGWHDDTQCDRSYLVVNSYIALFYAYATALTSDYTYLPGVMQYMADLISPVYRNYSINDPTLNYDGFRPDGSLQVYYNSILLATEARDLITELTLLCEMALKAANTISSSQNAEAKKIQAAVKTIANSLRTFTEKSIIPFLIDCGLPDSVSGAQAVKFSNQPPKRMYNWFIGVGRVAHLLETSGYMSTHESKACAFYGTMLRLNSSCMDTLQGLFSDYNFGIYDFFQDRANSLDNLEPYVAKGHQYLPFSDQYLYTGENYTLLIGMYSFRTRCYQCLNDLNKNGFYQNAGALSIYLQGYTNQYTNYSAGAFPMNLTKPASKASGISSPCGNQMNSFETQAKARLVTAVHDLNHAFVNYEYYGVTSDRINTRTLYLVNTNIDAIHAISFVEGSVSSSLSDLTQTLLSFPLADTNDVVVAFCDGTEKIAIPVSELECTNVTRVIFNVQGTNSFSFSIALVFSEPTTMTMHINSKEASYTNNGDPITGTAKVFKKFIEVVVSRRATIRVGSRTSCPPLQYTLFPSAKAGLTDDELAALLSLDELSMVFGNYAPESCFLGTMNYTRLTWRRDEHALIGLVSYQNVPVPLVGTVRVTSPSPLSMVMAIDGNTARLTVRDPTALLSNPVSLRFIGLPSGTSVQHKGAVVPTSNGMVVVNVDVSRGSADNVGFTFANGIPEEPAILPVIPGNLGTTIMDQTDDDPTFNETVVTPIVPGVVATVTSSFVFPILIVACILLVAGIVLSIVFLVRALRLRRRKPTYRKPDLAVANDSFSNFHPPLYSRN